MASESPTVSVRTLETVRPPSSEARVKRVAPLPWPSGLPAIPAPHSIRGRCTSLECTTDLDPTVLVRVPAGPITVVAALCPTCDAELPASFKRFPIDPGGR